MGPTGLAEENVREFDKKKYDASEYVKILRKAYPNEKFTIKPLSYSPKAKCVFLSTNSTSLINGWNRDASDRDDGLEKDFAKFLKKSSLQWHWHSPSGARWWDGIEITPKDFEGHYSYYGTPQKRTPKNFPEDRKAEMQKAEALFKKAGYEVKGVEEAEENRNVVECTLNGVLYRMEYVENRVTLSETQKLIGKLERLTESYSYLVKRVYDYICKKTDKKVWVMSGGGMQVQAFFGTTTEGHTEKIRDKDKNIHEVYKPHDSRYLAILYLGMENEKDLSEEYTMVVEERANMKMFDDFDKEVNTVDKNRRGAILSGVVGITSVKNAKINVKPFHQSDEEENE
jgi:hypothetical protein